MVKKVKEATGLLLSSPITFLVMAGLYPVIFLTSKNWFIYEPRQLVFLLVIPIISGLAGALGFALIQSVKVEKKKKSLHPTRVIADRFLIEWGAGNIILLLTGLLVIFILLEANIRESNSILLGAVVVALASSLLVRRAGFYFINLAFALMLVLATAELVYSLSVNSTHPGSIVRGLDRKTDNKVTFKAKPNIYLVHLESYHSPEAMERIYEFNNSKFIKDLTSKDFFVAPNNFSNYPSTLTSVGSMFLQQHHYFKIATGKDDAVGVRDMIGGGSYNPTLAILKNNGYKIAYLHDNTYAFTGGSNLDYHYPLNNIHDSLLIFQSNTINKLRAKFFGFSETNAKVRDRVNSDKDEFQRVLTSKLDIAGKEKAPTFYYIKEDFGVNHTPSGDRYSWEESDNGWATTYVDKVKAANPKITDLVDRIIKNDSKAMIILYADHGAWRYRSVWVDEKNKDTDINRLIKERRNLNATDLALDMYGSFLAVRNPNGSARVVNGETHVNLFRVLFSSLSEDKLLLTNKPKNDSYMRIGKQMYRVVANGKALKRLEVANP